MGCVFTSTWSHTTIHGFHNSSPPGLLHICGLYRTRAPDSTGCPIVLSCLQEKEIESLAGKKEGCHDDVEFITVQRNKTLPAGADAPPAALPSSQLLQPLSTSSVDLGHPAEVRGVVLEGLGVCGVWGWRVQGSRGGMGFRGVVHLPLPCCSCSNCSIVLMTSSECMPGSPLSPHLCSACTSVTTLTQHMLFFCTPSVHILSLPPAGCLPVGGGASRQCTCQPGLHVYLGGLLCTGAVH